MTKPIEAVRLKRIDKDLDNLRRELEIIFKSETNYLNWLNYQDDLKLLNDFISRLDKTPKVHHKSKIWGLNALLKKRLYEPFDPKQLDLTPDILLEMIKDRIELLTHRSNLLVEDLNSPFGAQTNHVLKKKHTRFAELTNLRDILNTKLKHSIHHPVIGWMNAAAVKIKDEKHIRGDLTRSN